MSKIVGEIDIDSCRWVKILFARMNFAKRRKTSLEVDIPEWPGKEIEFHNIASKVEKCNIPSALIINIDQTLFKYVPAGNEILAR